MANYKAVDADQLDADLGKVADAIRAKGGTSAQLSFPAGFASAVANIQTGGTSENLDSVLTEQEALVAELQDVLRSKASGGGGDNPEMVAALINRIGTFECTNDLVTTVGKYGFYTSAITSANFPNATKVDNYGFYMCKSLESVNLPSVNELATSAFYQCEKLVRVEFPALTACYGGAFTSCLKLEHADFGKVKIINASTFATCRSLKALILRSTTVCSLSNSNAFTNCHHMLGTVNSTYNPNGDHDGFIYVPKLLVEDYKAATNWSSGNLATQFRALEDYTVDGTIYGSLDETKI